MKQTWQDLLYFVSTIWCTARFAKLALKMLKANALKVVLLELHSFHRKHSWCLWRLWRFTAAMFYKCPHFKVHTLLQTKWRYIWKLLTCKITFWKQWVWKHPNQVWRMCILIRDSVGISSEISCTPEVTMSIIFKASVEEKHKYYERNDDIDDKRNISESVWNGRERRSRKERNIYEIAEYHWSVLQKSSNWLWMRRKEGKSRYSNFENNCNFLTPSEQLGNFSVYEQPQLVISELLKRMLAMGKKFELNFREAEYLSICWRPKSSYQIFLRIDRCYHYCAIRSYQWCPNNRYTIKRYEIWRNFV